VCKLALSLSIEYDVHGAFSDSSWKG